MRISGRTAAIALGIVGALAVTGVATANVVSSHASTPVPSRTAGVADPATAPRQAGRPDFSGYASSTGGTGRPAGVGACSCPYGYGRRIGPACTGADAVCSVQVAITGTARLAGGTLRAGRLREPRTGHIRRIKLVTDDGCPFQGATFAAVIACRPEPAHIRTQRKSPGRNGRRERAEHYRACGRSHPTGWSTPGVSSTR